MATRVLILEPGDKVQIPANVTVTGIITETGATLTTDCLNLPEQDTYVCIAFLFADSEAAASGGSLETMTIDTIEVGGTVYDINIFVDDGNPVIDYAININAITGPVFVVYGVIRDELSERTEWAISARVPSTLLDTVKFKVSGTGWGPSGAYVIPQDQDDCDCAMPSSGDQDDTFCDTEGEVDT